MHLYLLKNSGYFLGFLLPDENIPLFLHKISMLIWIPLPKYTG